MTASAPALAPLPARLARLVKIEHTVFALPFAYVGAFLAVGGTPSAHDLVWITLAMVGARSLAMAINRLVDAGIDARNPRTAGREIPSGQLSIVQVLLFCAASLALFLVVGLAARAAHALALADSRRRLRHLPVPQALDVALPLLARCGRRARADRRVGRDHEPPAVAVVGARRRRRVLDRRVRLLLRAVRHRRRSRGRTALDRHALRRARRVHCGARCRTSQPSRASSPSAPGSRSASSTGSASPSSRRCWSTSTRSFDRTTSAGSTLRSSR